MHIRSHQMAAALFVACSVASSGTVLYVDLNNPQPTAPYTNWLTAATNIQDAVDAANAEDTVLVTNGVYRAGGGVVQWGLTNRVMVTKPITVQSVNGPEVTVIQGRQSAFGVLGWDAIRCVYLTNNASLSGFTLTNGATSVCPVPITMNGGAVYCEPAAVVSNCILAGNSAWSGGAAYGGTLNNCRLLANWAASVGGGAHAATLNGCFLFGNSTSDGGGACASTLRNCTIIGNSATNSAGGVTNCVLRNCIAYYNTAPFRPNYSGGTLNNCCATPLPTGGSGNLSDEPHLASLSHLSASSPCLGAGNAADGIGTDIDGEAWASSPAVGCDEYRAGAVTGAVEVAMQVMYTNVASGFEVVCTAQISGRLSVSWWDFGDGTVVSNRPFAAHHWAHTGDYPVVLWACNETYPGGISATTMVHVIEQPVCHVALGGTRPAAPYLSWDTAATNIQDALDVAYVGSTVLVSNGVYGTGGCVVFGQMSNRVAVTKPLLLQSVNGPAATFIVGGQAPGVANGDGAVRCVYLTNRATLSGFTLTGGATRSSGDSRREQNGGGVWCESTDAVVSNCVVAGNTAFAAAGGVYSGTVRDSTLTGNSTPQGYGGAASLATLRHCTVANNTGSIGSGVAYPCCRIVWWLPTGRSPGRIRAT